MKPDKSKIIDILMTEYTQACNRVVYLDDQANRYINYILVFVGALAAVLGLLFNDGQSSDSLVLSLIISIGTLIIGLLIIMALYYTMQCFRLGGYIKHLELEVNFRLGFSLLNWESKVAPKYIHKDITAILIYIVMGIVFAALLTGAVWVSVVFVLPVWPILAIIIFVVGAFEMITGVVYLIKAFTVHEKIHSIFSDGTSNEDEPPINSVSVETSLDEQAIKKET